MITNEQVDELIDYLRGTCKTLNEGTQDLFEKDEEILSQSNLEKIDNEIFRCEQCDWWFDDSELNDNKGSNFCDDCNREQEVGEEEGY